MFSLFKRLKDADRQTLFFILMIAIYGGALLWTTIQSYARLDYQRTDRDGEPIIIQPKPDHS